MFALVLCALLAPSIVPLAQNYDIHPVAGIAELVSIPRAHAQSSIGDTASKFFGVMLEITTVLNWVVLGMVQTVLNPDFIFGELVNGVRPMEPILRKIWMVSRDIVNAIFAFILIVAAIMVILKGQMNIIKEKAPMFVIAIILVNFSWFFPRVILDMANVMQATVYQIPNLINSSAPCVSEVDYGADGVPGGNGDNADQVLPCNFVWKVHVFPTMCEGAACPPRPNMGENFPKKGKQIGTLVDIYYADWGTVRRDGGYQHPACSNGFCPVSGADTVVNGLAVNFAKLPHLARVDFELARMSAAQAGNPTDKATAYIMFTLHLIFNAIISLAIGLLLLSMLVVFIVRVGVIWLCVAFMPFVFLGIALRGNIGSIGEIPGAGLNIWKIFLKYAFLPALVAIPLTVGFILLSQAPAVSWLAQNPGAYMIDGLPKILGIQTFHELMWLAVTLGILWIGTFKVLEKSDEFGQKIWGGIKSAGEGAMKFGVKTIGYAPIVPMPSSQGGQRRRTSPLDILQSVKHAANYGKGAWSFLPQQSTTTPTGSTANLPSQQQINNSATKIANWNELARILKDGILTDRQKFQQGGAALVRGSQGTLSQQNAEALLKNPAALDKLLNHRDSRAHASEKGEIMDHVKNMNIHQTINNPVLKGISPKTNKKDVLGKINSGIARLPDDQIKKTFDDLKKLSSTSTGALEAVRAIDDIMTDSNIDLKAAIQQASSTAGNP